MLIAIIYSSLKIIESYEDSRIKVINFSKNMGIAAALNKGLKAAKGYYVARQDQDDISLPDRFMLQIESLENNDIDYTLFGIDIYRTGLEDMFGILFKATLGVTMGIVLTAVTTTIELIYGLQKLKLPQIIIAIMSFAIRYIDVFIDEFKRVRISMRSRGYQEKGIKGLIPIAYASGAMLIRGYERGERVYLSMISRGFNGSIELKKREYDNSVLLIFLTLISIFVLIVDKYL